MAVIDVFTYNGEREILDLHFNILSPHVDKFIVVEAKTTFSGHKKPLYFSRDEQYFSEWWPKTDYFIIDENYSEEEIALAESSPNTQGAAHWKHEFLQKESILKALKQLKVKDDDIVYIGDVDEIWEPYHFSIPAKLKLRVYAYRLNNRSNEEFWGTFVGRYGDIKDKCLNHLRTDASLRTKDFWGWHFTSMGGIKEISRKLNDSYTTESYNTLAVQEILPQRIAQGKDYLGRDFRFGVDASQWPLYLKKNVLSYINLL